MATKEEAQKHSWNDPAEKDDRDPLWERWTGAVLLSDEITYYCTQPAKPLITPFDATLLKPARYQLRLGNEARVGGKTQHLDKEHPLIIEPHQVAIVRTHEVLTIPRFLIGRWNLRVDMVYKGLLWVGALQVDPGWVGHLPCPLYNLSDKPVVIDYLERVFTIDFVRTTPVKSESIRYPYPGRAHEIPINPSVAFYDAGVLRSGPYEALKDLAELREFRRFVSAFIGVILTVLGVVIAALGVLVARPGADITQVNGRLIWFWPTTAIAASAIALGFSLFTFIFTVRQHGAKRSKR
jgi:dCTP deaminase